jgi:hypothetical protein
VKKYARRIARLLIVYFFVTVEYYERTGAEGGITDRQVQDRLREDIRDMTGDTEFSILYRGEPVDTPGSQSKLKYANGDQVLSWILKAIGRVCKLGGISAPIANAMIGHVGAILKESQVMDTIDKTQFPFPYAQIVKILNLIWVFTLPFFLVSKSGAWSPIIATLAALGYFGLDEVAEILESPFGEDANDINLREYGVELMRDLEMTYNNRDTEIDTVFSDDADGINFEDLLAGRFKGANRCTLSALAEPKKAPGIRSIKDATAIITQARRFEGILSRPGSRGEANMNVVHPFEHKEQATTSEQGASIVMASQRLATVAS